MFDFHEKRKLKSRIYSLPVIAVLLAFTVFLSFSVAERYKIEREMAGKRVEKMGELEELKQRASALESEVTYLESERGIEAEIRDRFEVAKEGEQVIVIVDNSAPEQERSPEPAQKKRSSMFDWLIFW